MLDRSNPLPLVHQLEEYISNQIISGTYAVGSLIPSQDQIAKDLGISRITVRNALVSLMKKNILISKKAKGTYVIQVPTNNLVTLKHSFTTNNKFIVLETNTYFDECMHLNCEKGHFISFLNMKQEEIFSVDRIWWNTSVKINTLSEQHLQNITIEDIYKICDIRVTSYKETLAPRISDSILADIMNLPSATPLLCIKRQSYNDYQQQAFEYRETFIRYEDFSKIIFNSEWKG
ncbi:MAG: GntR family transcriptional regulator [Brevinema sp.]